MPKSTFVKLIPVSKTESGIYVILKGGSFLSAYLGDELANNVAERLFLDNLNVDESCVFITKGGFVDTDSAVFLLYTAQLPRNIKVDGELTWQSLADFAKQKSGEDDADVRIILEILNNGF